MSKPSEGRLEAIAFNAIQQSRIAHGVGNYPWSDRDARLAGMITKLLSEVQKAYSEDDTDKLVPKAQVSVSKPLVNVEQLLGSIEEDDKPALVVRGSGFRSVVDRLNESEMLETAKTYP
jgi:hypothetical protein